MAEGVSLMSITNGSDADIEYTCSPCGEDNVREQAVKYCPVCEEYLCTTCTRLHGRQKATRSHALLHCDDSTRKASETMVTKCRYHPDRDIEMYCREHDMVYCTKCIAHNHRSCSGVSDLREINTSLNQHNDFQRLSYDIVNIQKRLKDTEQMMQTNVNIIEDQRNEIMAQIKGVKLDLVEYIQELERKAFETLEIEYTLVKEELHTKLSDIRTIKQEIERTVSLQRTANLNTSITDQFVQTKLINRAVNDSLIIFEQSETMCSASLCFTQNLDLKSSIITSASIGRVEKVTEKKSVMTTTIYKVISKKEIDIGMENDQNCSYISDMCQLPDGTIILADNNQSRLKRLDENHNIKDCFDLESYPTGICCTGNTEIAVNLYNNKVLFVSVGNSLFKLRDISLSEAAHWGMANCDRELWLTSSNCINAYSTSGTLLRSINTDINGEQIFKQSPEQMTAYRDIVIITDNSDGAVCLKREGTVIRQLRDKRLVDTRGVCVSNNGTVFIAGFTSNNIMMFDKDGKCLGELVDEEGGLQDSLSMCYDKRKNSLLVACYNSNKLIEFNISN